MLKFIVRFILNPILAAGFGDRICYENNFFELIHKD
jgi:hypothetical protein